MEFDIPKEIKSKPKMFGMEVKELVILLIGSFLVFTILSDMVHGLFTIPFYIVSAITLLWIIMPSRNNPQIKNYMSVILYFIHNRQTYHTLDTQRLMNDLLFREDEVKSND